MRDLVLAIGGLLMILTLGPAAAAQPGRESSSKNAEVVTPESKMYKSLKARSIGPAIMSGRVSTIALDPDELFTFYVGLGTGGVMRTKDNGATYEAIFEKEAVAAIGAIAVSPSNAKQVWVGTGEANDKASGGDCFRNQDAIAADYFFSLSDFSKLSEAELMQYRRPVGSGPSSKIWPRCAPHLLQ